MLRIRLFWFAVGFSVTGTAISQFVWRDLMNDRLALSSQLKQRYDALNARVSNLESVGHENPSSLQDNLEKRLMVTCIEIKPDS
ncbi:hypothetical protein RJ641_004611, partial [Dillenia turbinata]